MTFTRPTNITLTQMAQWVDSHQHPATRAEEDQLVEYLYHLSYANAGRASLFNDSNTYDDFAIFCVSKLLIRLSNPKEQPLKSVVNYLKTVLSLWKNEYIRAFCPGSADLQLADFDVTDFGDYLVDSASEYDLSSYSFACFKASHVVGKHLLKIPRKRKSAEWSNIYASCLLTLHDRLTAAILLHDSDVAKQSPEVLDRTLRQLKTRPAVLYHLDESMAPYISVLVNELTHCIAAEISFTSASKVSVTACLRNLVIAASNEEDN